MKVKDIMTREVITVKEDQTKQQAARLMAEHRISGLPVVNDDGMLVGLLTEHDIIGSTGNKVRDIMTRGIISVSEDSDIEEVSRILVHQRIKRLLVLEQGRLVGVISRGDLVKEVAMHWVCPICGEETRSYDPPQYCVRCDAVGVATPSEVVSPGF